LRQCDANFGFAALGHALIKEFRFDRGCDSTLSEQGSDSMGRYDLTDFEWAAIQPVLPNKPRGVKWTPDLGPPVKV
jgi:hypothetical protein